jgi:hypothetical protein
VEDAIQSGGIIFNHMVYNIVANGIVNHMVQYFSWPTRPALGEGGRPPVRNGRQSRV